MKPKNEELAKTAAQFKLVMERCYELFVEKNNHHQNKVFKHGVPGILVRVDDKIGDANAGGKPGETIIESLMDIANYAILGIIIAEGKTKQ